MNVGVVGNHVENVVQAFQDAGHHVISGVPDYSYLTTHVTTDCDLLIAFPPCKNLCSSGLHWNKKRPERAQFTEDALAYVIWLMSSPAKHICLENPVGCISTRIRKPDQFIEPHWFGHDAKKRTCLWLKNLPHLRPTKMIAPRLITAAGAQRWGNQFDSGQNNLVAHRDRALLRAVRYQGIADAMAAQWGIL